MVHGDVPSQQKDRTCQAVALRATPPGTDRDGTACTISSNDAAEGQSQDASNSPVAAHRSGTGRGRRLVGSDPRGGRDGDSTSPGSDEPDGSGDARSPWTSEAHGRREPQLSPEAQTGQTASPSLIADLCEAWHNINLQEHVDPVDIFGDKDEGDVIFHTRETNWVAQEMWEHFAQKGIFPTQPC